MFNQGKGLLGMNMSPQAARAMQGAGLALSQLSAGRPANLAPLHKQMYDEQQGAKMQEALGPALERMPPEMRSLVASMPPALGAKYVADFMMQKPKAVNGVNINGRLVNPQTGQLIADYSDGDAGYSIIPPEEAAQLGLPPGKQFQRSHDGKISQIGGAGVTVTTNVGDQTKGGETFDKEMAKDLQDFSLTGASDMSKNLSQLKAVREGMVTGEAGNVSGPVIGPVSKIPGIGSIIAPNAINAQEQIAEVVQRNLKEILGAQFTEKEGAQLIARAFNPSLDDDVNIGRLDRLIRQMELAYQQKASAAKYFAEHQTLNGWSGSLPSINDFDILGDNPPGAGTRLKYNPTTGEFE